MNHRTKLLAVLTTASLMAPSLASAAKDYNARGRVLETVPVYETVRVNQPTQRCWDEEVYRPSNTAVPTIAGAIVGGVVGNQFGKGSGKDAATVAGALLGGAVGNQVGQSHGGTQVERRCETVNHYKERQEVVGYRVKYEYQGQVAWTRTQYKPGRYIDLDVSVRPAR